MEKDFKTEYRCEIEYRDEQRGVARNKKRDRLF